MTKKKYEIAINKKNCKNHLLVSFQSARNMLALSLVMNLLTYYHQCGLLPVVDLIIETG